MFSIIDSFKNNLTYRLGLTIPIVLLLRWLDNGFLCRLRDRFIELMIDWALSLSGRLNHLSDESSSWRRWILSFPHRHRCEICSHHQLIVVLLWSKDWRTLIHNTRLWTNNNETTTIARHNCTLYLWRLN